MPFASCSLPKWRFSMKLTGARTVARTPILAMCSSTAYLLSKCGTPVCRLAEPTELKTRCTPAALAASAADIPCRLGVRASFEWCRHREEGGRSFERLRERGRVFERRVDQCYARVCELPRLRGVG